MQTATQWGYPSIEGVFWEFVGLVNDRLAQSGILNFVRGSVMARTNRRDVLADGDIQVVHCINRCPRRAFLCGKGKKGRTLSLTARGVAV